MRLNHYSLAELEARATALRRHVVRMVARLKIGYLQQGLGAADLFAALYFSELQLSETDPAWAERDRFILSTAHHTAVFYATMAERGLIPMTALDDYTVDGSPYEVNASERVGPLVEATCGSLGQGLSVAVGMALALRRKGSRARTRSSPWTPSVPSSRPSAGPPRRSTAMTCPPSSPPSTRPGPVGASRI